MNPDPNPKTATSTARLLNSIHLGPPFHTSTIIIIKTISLTLVKKQGKEQSANFFCNPLEKAKLYLINPFTCTSSPTHKLFLLKIEINLTSKFIFSE
jgi:hypothetical protein